jgi:hypothetical protein
VAVVAVTETAVAHATEIEEVAAGLGVTKNLNCPLFDIMIKTP